MFVSEPAQQGWISSFTPIAYIIFIQVGAWVGKPNDTLTEED
jgi:hypothetical protein